MSLIVTCKDGEFSFKITSDDDNAVRVSGASSVTVTMDNAGLDNKPTSRGKKSDSESESDSEDAASSSDQDEYLAGDEDGDDDALAVATPKAPQYIGGSAPLGRNGSATRTKDHTK